MECPSETRLQALADGTLPEGELDALLAHLDSCGACRKLVARTQAVRDGADGDRVGRYLLRGLLGSGGMGVVYEAFDPELGRVVALKLLREAATDALQARLVDEARSMARLSHPHVVSVYDIGTHDGCVYIVMELVDGSSLRAHLTTPRSTAEIVELFAEAAEGLVSIHAAGLVHRDFKPDNVLVTREGRALVSDLGIAVSHEDRHAGSAGSPAYMAPEQRRGVVDARSDQYAFGVALAEATPGPRPRWLARIVARTTALEPAARFASMRAVALALRSGLRRRPRMIALATGAVLLALVGGATFWLGGSRQRAAALCRDPGAGAWNDGARAQIEHAFSSTKSALAADAWKAVREGLDAYAADLRATRRSVCEATRVRGEQSERLLDAKVACLDQREQVVAAEVQLMTHADAALLERVPALLQVLPSVSACRSASVAPSVSTPRPDELLAVRAGRELVAASAVAVAAGRYDEGRALGERGVAALDVTHDLDAQAEAALWLGAAQGRLGRLAEAEPTLSRAAASASAAGDSLLAARAWIQLAHFVGLDGNRPEEGLRYDTYAETALQSASGVAELRAEQLSWRSALLSALHRDAEALETSRRQLALAEAQLGTHHRLYASALDGVAGILADEGASRDALPLQAESCRALEEALGAKHPLLALCLNNLGALHANLGEHEQALAAKRRALAIYRELPGHPGQLAMVHRNLARSLLALGRLHDAAGELASLDAADPATSLVRGELERRTDPERAIVDLARLAATHPTVDVYAALAEAELDAHELAHAELDAARAVELARQAAPFRRAQPLWLLAEAELARGEDARPAIAEAQQIVAKAQLDPLLVARLAYARARSEKRCDVSDAERAQISARDPRLARMLLRCR